MRAIWIRATVAATIAIFFACTNGNETDEPVIEIGEADGEAGEASAYWNNEPPLSLEDIELGRHDSTWLGVVTSDTSDIRLAGLDTVAVEPISLPPLEIVETFPETYSDFERLSPGPADSALPAVRLPVTGDDGQYRIVELLVFHDVAALAEQERRDRVDDARALRAAGRQDECSRHCRLLSTRSRSQRDRRARSPCTCPSCPPRCRASS